MTESCRDRVGVTSLVDIAGGSMRTAGTSVCKARPDPARTTGFGKHCCSKTYLEKTQAIENCLSFYKERWDYRIEKQGLEPEPPQRPLTYRRLGQQRASRHTGSDPTLEPRRFSEH